MRWTLMTACLVGTTLTACDPPPQTRESRGAQSSDSEQHADAKTKAAEVPRRYAGITLGSLSDSGKSPPFDAFLNKSPQEVEALLGAPTSSGQQRISCARYLPDRVFFACEHLIARYDDPKGRVAGIEIDFEDGHAASVSVVGLPGEGEFSPAAALKVAGVSVPGKPKRSNPDFIDRSAEPEQATVDLWSYFNGEARLLIDGMEHRVEVSAVNGEWARSRVKVVNNHPLDEDQKSRVKEPKDPPG